jgi:hypothetical protein
MPLQRVRVAWTNFSGAPGYSNFYSSVGTPPPLAAIRTFFEAVKTNLPTGLTLTYPGTGDEFNETTGQITGSWVATPPANTVGTGGANYVGPAGVVVEWLTSQVLDGRRPIGKTFLVPLIVSTFESDGSPTSAFVTSASAAAAALVTATLGQLFIWHRPIRDPEPPHSITRIGGLAQISSSRVPDLSAVMRSRRR